MKLINRENGEELVEVGSHKDYASKGVAGAGLGLGKVNQALSIIADENGMIDADGILNDMIDNLIISPVKEERGIKIGAGTVEIKIPFINKAIALDKDDINEFKEMLSKIQQ